MRHRCPCWPRARARACTGGWETGGCGAHGCSVVAPSPTVAAIHKLDFERCDEDTSLRARRKVDDAVDRAVVLAGRSICSRNDSAMRGVK